MLTSQQKAAIKLAKFAKQDYKAGNLHLEDFQYWIRRAHFCVFKTRFLGVIK